MIRRKTTADTVARIRAMRKQGYKQTAIASYLGCAQSTVSDALKNTVRTPIDPGRIRALRRAGWGDYEIAKDMTLAIGRDVMVEEILDARMSMNI